MNRTPKPVVTAKKAVFHSLSDAHRYLQRRGRSIFPVTALVIFNKSNEFQLWNPQKPLPRYWLTKESWEFIPARNRWVLDWVTSPEEIHQFDKTREANRMAPRLKRRRELTPLACIVDQEGWNQKALAEAAGIPRSTLQNAMRHGSNPTLSTLAAIAAALGMKTWELVRMMENVKNALPK